ncbi:MAG: hypothetical protein K2J00_00315 [Bacteroidaceae bacterium]|nr:hypothetical protein [Bacteroidaceae bacterium]
MKKMKIENVQELGQILTAEEMANVVSTSQLGTCKCKLKLYGNPIIIEMSPLGNPMAESNCNSACPAAFRQSPVFVQLESQI